MKQRKPKPQPRYPYPFLACSYHPGPQRSYIMCRHVFEEKTTPAVREMATGESPGLIVCAQCDQHHPKLTKTTFRVTCEGCVVDRGLLLL